MTRWTPHFFHLCICPQGINKPAGSSPDSQDSRRWTSLCGGAGPPGSPAHAEAESLGSPAHAEAGPAARGKRRARRRELAAAGTDHVPIGKASPRWLPRPRGFPAGPGGREALAEGRPRGPGIAPEKRASARPIPAPAPSGLLPGRSGPGFPGPAGRKLPSRLRPRSVPRTGPSPGRPPPPREPPPPRSRPLSPGNPLPRGPLPQAARPQLSGLARQPPLSGRGRPARPDLVP